MTIYEHTTSLTTASASVSSTTLNVMGGILRQVLVRANTSTTVFRVDLEDSDAVTRLNYDYHTGELNDVDVAFPITGVYTLNITNASPDDTFRIVLAVQEN